MSKPLTEKYKYDVAISLCKEDLDFARKLVKALNPSLPVFFYENRQAELISKSGPEAFAKLFKEQSRVVVILSRKEWSESFYTDIERNAIIDRTSVKNEGYNFLMVVPLKPGEIPIWYPSTRIYVDPHRFTVDEIAKFIEFKVTEEGGAVKPLTVEDRYKNLVSRIEQKQTIIQLQQAKEAINQAENEVKVFKDCFNRKIDFLKEIIFDSTSYYFFSDNVNTSYYGIGNFLLQCNIILPEEFYARIVTTQDFIISFELSETNEDKGKKLLVKEQRRFYFNPPFSAWSLPHLYEQPIEKDLLVLFKNRDNSKFYDLINPVNTSILVDNWFQKLLTHAAATIERYL